MSVHTEAPSWMCFVHFIFLLAPVSCNTEFEISVPTRVQMAVYGEAVLLSCTFPVSGSWDAGSSVITWQRHLEVVHSFFHGRDHPRYQSPRYANRTSLFHQEMNKGNASLRLDRTTLEDAGEYTCSISTQLGSQMKSFGLKVAAFYTEPRLHISMLNDGHVEVRVTSEGGYPSPSLQWLMGNESDITNVTHTQLRQDQHTRLYSVNSKLNLSGTVNSSITFIMKNPDLGQEIRRNIDLLSENGRHDEYKQKVSALFLLGLLTGVVFILFVISVVIFLRQKRLFKCFSPNGDVSEVQSSELSLYSNHQRQAETCSGEENECVAEPRSR
ncbi:CD276 antigen isoform X2 [Pangasianodon hypophthalmus]|uniref:CD276 antigen isoform X2 n=1 Tax=Pangasianodon hypophthalmus TaxID=310915 RepID=UPI0023076D1E|nr:CD276 antigen isoform X2 [Pangasianodon hypophthalmus]